MKASKDLKIAFTGTGYVGLFIAALLSQHHQVTAREKVYTRDIFQRDLLILALKPVFNGVCI